MRSTDRIEFLRVLNGLAAVLPGAQLTAEALEIWWGAMAQWTLAEFRGAASLLVSKQKWMPGPHDFEALRRVDEPTAVEAWAQALAACRGWRHPDALPQGRIARAAAAVGGYRAIAMSDVEAQLPHIARQFKEAYDQLSTVEETRESLAALGLGRLSGPKPKSGFQLLGKALE